METDLIGGIVASIFGAFFIARYFYLFTYDRTYDTFLQNKTFMNFLFSLNTSYKLRYFIPWFFRNKEAEKQFPQMKAIASKIIMLTIACFGVFIVMIIIMESQGTTPSDTIENTDNKTKAEVKPPPVFDTLKLSGNDKEVIREIIDRRVVFEKFITDNNIERNVCPCCGFPSLVQRYTGEICILCNWADDGQDDATANEMREFHGDISLTQGRMKTGKWIKHMEDSLKGKLLNDPDALVKIFNQADKEMIDLNDSQPGPTSESQEWIDIRYRLLKDIIK
jgi:hypothetical protein